MSDSHVNDIRYTALWRPVVKAREAPAATPSLPLFSSLCSIGVLLFLSFRQLYQHYSVAFLVLYLRTNTDDLCRACGNEFVGSNAVVGMPATANSICSDGKRDESIRSL